MGITLAGILRGAIARYRPRIALRVGDDQWTYGDLDAASDALAAGLTKLGMARGHRIALYMKNCAEYVVADLALLKIGAVKVPLNEYQSTGDVTHILNETGAKALVAHQSLLAGLGSTSAERPRLPHVVCVPEAGLGATYPGQHRWDNVLVDEPFVAVQSAPDDIALITYTGGTTGTPKGVVQKQASLALNLYAHIVAGEVSATDLMLLSTPLPHSAGYHLQACLLQGGQVILQRRFDPPTFYAVVEECRISWAFLVPTMIYRLLEYGGSPGRDHSSLRTIVYGAAPMSSAQLHRAIDKFGLCFIQLYGQTECPNYITALTKDDHRNPDLHESCGKAVPFVDVATTAEDHKGLGEVIVRSPYLLSEYLKNPDATRTTLQDGWLHTGDIGYIDDDGYLFLKDRAKDMVISGGMNIYTSEVEQVIKRHPAVADAAVIGLPHADWGEQVHAVVAIRNDAEITGNTLIDFCKGKLSRYKVPKTIEFRAALPLTSYGKVDKKALRRHRSVADPA